MSELYAIAKSTLDDIGNAIRTKNGTTDPIPVENLATEILNIGSEPTYYYLNDVRNLGDTSTEYYTSDVRGRVIFANGGDFNDGAAITSIGLECIGNGGMLRLFYEKYSSVYVELGELWSESELIIAIDEFIPVSTFETEEENIAHFEGFMERFNTIFTEITLK